jgi:tetraacyldisaccharide 4'-kinase
MRAPDFWWRAKPSLLSALLLPTSLVYGAIAAGRMRRRGEIAALPVICIGNFTAGGAGKTPTAIAVAEILAASGELPAFLSRGYGGREAGPLQVEPRHTSQDVGDEPRLLARIGTTIVSRDRPAGACLAVESGATAIVMDDGLQNPSLVKDCTIAVIDGAAGIGNGLAIPSGPLRAPMGAQWPAVDAVLIIGEGAAGESITLDAKRHGKRVFAGRLVPDEACLASLRDARVLAFAGIGRPEKFFDTLRASGIVVEETRSFADHHAYTAAEITTLMRLAESRGLTPVTTEKDMARLSGAASLPTWPGLSALPVRLRVDEETAFRNLLLRRIAERRTRGASA